MLSAPQASLYRRLTLGDDALITSLMSGADAAADALGRGTASLVRLAALIVIDADTQAYQCEVRDAISAGASPEQVTAVLAAVGRVAGSALLMSAAPKMALALGYDVDAGLEDGDSIGR